MLRLDNHKSGRNFLQIPGPTNVPDRILRAISYPTIDHRGPEFQQLILKILPGLQKIFQTQDPVVILGSSGTGAWEAALVNTLSPGDRVIMYNTGHFATLWKNMAEKFGLVVDFIDGDWRTGVEAEVIYSKLSQDKNHTVKAVAMLHNETSTGIVSNVLAVRQAIDKAKHPALLMVDTVSSLASIDYRHGEWGVDVTVGGSQKGLMLPPGLAFNAVSKKALEAHKNARLPRSYFDWTPILESNKQGFFPYTSGTNLLYGLHESIDMLLDEGLPQVFARHHRFAEATRKAVQAWGLEILCKNPKEYSDTLTAILLPEGHDAEKFRFEVLKHADISLGMGFKQIAKRIFRIGHLGSFNEPMLLGTLGGVELGLKITGVPYKSSGVEAAIKYLNETLVKSNDKIY
jgi:alanine-glyoxylate transaminase/serine-glyoxylate transaminase/serine-pyruvate transaminase